METNQGNLDLRALTIKDVIEIDLLQRFQDDFAKGVGVACLTVDPLGSPITNHSCCTNFCSKFKESTEHCHRLCLETHRRNSEEAARVKRPVIYKCHAGLIGFATPIIVEDKPIGSFLGGQVLIEQPEEAEYREIAVRIGADEDDYVQAVQKVPKITREKVEAAANVLFFVANNISNIAYMGLRMQSVAESITSGLLKVSATMDQLDKRQRDLSVKVKKIRIGKMTKHLM